MSIYLFCHCVLVFTFQTADSSPHKIVGNENEVEKKVLSAFFKPSSKLLSQGSGYVALGIKPVEKFSVFHELHMKTAHEAVKKLIKLPLDQMINTLSTLRMNRGVTRFTEFITRTAFSKKPETANVELPPSYQTIPHWFFPLEVLTKNGSVVPETSTKEDPEHTLSWWREDTTLGEHHSNWHYLYPYTEPVKHKQGELFAYMHQQVLARYDTERLAVGVERVRAFGPGYCWDGPLAEGYNPQLKGMSFRASNMKIGTVARVGRRLVSTDMLSRNKDRLFTAVAKGYMEFPNGTQVEITMDRLGNTVESNMGSINKKVYGNIHNDGHAMIAFINDPVGAYHVETGPMYESATAPRDPAFYRWHKFVDEFFEAHRSDLDPYTEQDLVMTDITITSVSTFTETLAGISIKNRTNHLYTFMENKTYNVYDLNKSLGEKQEPIIIFKKQLNHAPYKLNITVTNSGNYDALVAFRVFIALKSESVLEEGRNMFIEIDKFVATIKPGGNTVTRDDAQSSVVRATHRTIEDILGGAPQSARATNSHKCGWPLELLLPRGTVLGMDFDLFLIATDWKNDIIDTTATLEGGISYCGIGNGTFPDTRPMGFPFDRKFDEIEELEDLLKLVPNSARSELKIKFLETYNPVIDGNILTEEHSGENEEETGY